MHSVWYKKTVINLSKIQYGGVYGDCRIFTVFLINEMISVSTATENWMVVSSYYEIPQWLCRFTTPLQGIESKSIKKQSWTDNTAGEFFLKTNVFDSDKKISCPNLKYIANVCFKTLNEIKYRRFRFSL